MLEIINEPLFSFKTEKKEDKRNGDEFYCLYINTCAKITRKNDAGEEIPSVRTFATLSSPEKSYSDYHMVVHSKDNEDGKRFVTIKAVKESNYDANVFVVAFPFNGIIKPITFDKRYRIHKGMISMSDDYNIPFNGKTYRKVLYLVIEPYMKVFEGDENHEAIDELTIPIESYSTMKDKKDPNAAPKSCHESMTLHIKKDGYTVEWNSAVEEYEDMSKYKDTPIYNLYNWKPKNTYGNTSNTTQTNAVTAARTSTFKKYGEGKTNLDIPKCPEEAQSNRGYRQKPAKSGNFYNKDANYDDDYPAKKSGNRGKKSKKQQQRYN